MATTKTAKKAPVKAKAKAPMTKKATPLKKTVATKTAPKPKAATNKSAVRSKKTRMIVTLGSEEKRLFTLVSIWLALIAVFLGMVVYQTYIK